MAAGREGDIRGMEMMDKKGRGTENGVKRGEQRGDNKRKRTKK